MTVPIQDNQSPESKQGDKELNFRALEARYKQQLEQERQARMEAERKVEEALKRREPQDDDDDDEPYVDKKKLNKTLAKFGEQTKQQTQNEIQKEVHKALTEERRQNWVKNNP